MQDPHSKVVELHVPNLKKSVIRTPQSFQDSCPKIRDIGGVPPTSENSFAIKQALSVCQQVDSVFLGKPFAEIRIRSKVVDVDHVLDLQSSEHIGVDPDLGWVAASSADPAIVGPLAVVGV